MIEHDTNTVVDVDEIDTDGLDVPEPVDVSDCPTAAAAAQQTHEQLNEHAHEDERVLLLDPDTAVEKGFSDAWIVLWEAGPIEWGLLLSGGESVYSREKLYFTDDGEYIDAKPRPEVYGFADADSFEIECERKFALGFYDR